MKFVEFVSYTIGVPKENFQIIHCGARMDRKDLMVVSIRVFGSWSFERAVRRLVSKERIECMLIDDGEGVVPVVTAA